ncbi:toxin-antitoxin system YwqK family antitoxin [Leptospira sarikeiensis]|nr:hypothetical protein [Leptospira sarikeiensis]
MKLILIILFTINLYAEEKLEKPSEDNYLSKYENIEKEVPGGFQATRLRDGEFFDRIIIYYKTHKEIGHLPPETIPKAVPKSAKFNFIFSKWEDLSVIDGKRPLYYGTSGKKAGYIEVVGGLYEGEMILYWPTGKLKKKVSYKNGKENGLIYFYNRRGELLVTFTMKDGIADGEACRYDKTGKVIFKEQTKRDREYVEKYGFLG